MRWLALFLPLFLLTQASAQEALVNTLSLDRYLLREPTALVPAPPDTPHLGPVRFNLSIEARAEYNDNINYSDHAALSDAILGGGFHTDLLWPISESAQLALNGGLMYLAYLQHPAYSRIETGPASVLSWNVGFPNGSFSVFNQFSYNQDVGSEPSITGLASYPRFEENPGFRITWWPGKWLLQGGYSHDIFWTDSTAFEYLNRSSEYFFGRVARRLAEQSEIGIEGSFSLTDYDQPIQNDNHSWSLGPYLDWHITETFQTSARGGITRYSFEDSTTSSSQSAGSNFDSYYLGLELDHRLTRYLRQHLGIRRDVRLGINKGTDLMEETTGWYSLSYQLTDYITLTLGLGYTHGTQSLETIFFLFRGVGIPVLAQEVYDQYIGAPEISWRVTDKITAYLDYRYSVRTSNLPDRDYRINSVALRLSYAF